jgi:hypothetical protein
VARLQRPDQAGRWPLDAWPAKLAEIQAITHLPIWVTEVGASSFGAEVVQRYAIPERRPTFDRHSSLPQH